VNESESFVGGWASSSGPWEKKLRPSEGLTSGGKNE
jgi:hypothetical protein